ncbi:MarR family winged helix-turn-helix transcriptional regulator [Pseudonocardia sp. GCM10023141]|uniref:MarR family winged helix-turn-helix transcriptional regulator n=1 Tax=Pseudonocardia sp. GCM10023141 TaxID=3252653 RepID=UPI00361B01FF
MPASKDDAAALSRTVTRMLDATRRGQSRAYDPVRVGILSVVVEQGPLRPGAIAEELDVLPSSATRHVQALQDAGLVSIAVDPTDRRASLIEATDAGREQAAQFGATGTEVFHAVVADWPAADVVALTALLDRLIDAWAARGAEQQRAARTRRRFDWSES